MSVGQTIGRNGSGRLDIVYAPIFINIFIYTYVYIYTYATVGSSLDQPGRVGRSYDLALLEGSSD